MKNRFLEEFESGEVFASELKEEINRILNEESEKPEAEMDLELISDCVDALAYLNEYEEREAFLTQKTVKGFNKKLKLSRLAKGFGTAVAVLVIALAVVFINNTFNHDSFVVPEETASSVQASVNGESTLKETTTKNPDESQTSASNRVAAKRKTKKKPNNKKEETTEEKQEEEVTEETSKKSEKTTEDADDSDETTTETTTKSIKINKKLVSISGSFGGEFKTVYRVGERFDSSGLEVVAVYSDKTTKSIPLDNCSISGFSSAMPGTKNVTVSYKGKSFSFRVTVRSSAN
ncbi:MAG: hypothetical protein E7570_03565 [Ruminococcaceae bacterium]|nr:hypothetical protein [Oscillospiraceae bacterium]